METPKTPFVAPSLTIEASLEDVTLISGDGGRHGKHNNRNNNRHNNNNQNNHGHGGHRSS
jgi:hypothetical protein